VSGHLWYLGSGCSLDCCCLVFSPFWVRIWMIRAQPYGGMRIDVDIDVLVVGDRML